jgi:hypothetical protein
MARARQKASPTDRHARKIAVAIANGRSPAPTPDLEFYLESSPHEMLAALEGAARNMPPAGSDEALGFSYLFLLQGLLERLRYRTDNGYADAADLNCGFSGRGRRAGGGRTRKWSHARLCGGGPAPGEDTCFAGTGRGVGESACRR